MTAIANGTAPSHDEVYAPAHYAGRNGIECIDAIRASMSDEEYRGWLKGQVFKYLWRFDKKGKPLQDVKKAAFYLERLRASLVD